MSETLVGVTARTVLFRVPNRGAAVTEFRHYPAGTEVHVTRLGQGMCTARVPGTLFEQEVGLSSVNVP